jgi:transcriptional regulator with XRE-family HTH domain
LRTRGGAWQGERMNAIATYKTEQGITLAELARRLGLNSRGHLCDVVAGRRPVTANLAKRLEPLCGKTWRELIDEPA